MSQTDNLKLNQSDNTTIPNPNELNDNWQKIDGQFMLRDLGGGYMNY